MDGETNFLSDLRVVPQYSQGPPAGIFNLGNTCYVNAALQVLSNCEPLRQYFLSTKFFSIDSFSLHFANILMHLYQGSATKGSMAERSNVVYPFAFVRKIKIADARFQGNDQHDSQEFIDFLLDALHEEIAKENLPFAPSPIPTSPRSVISTTFTGSMKNEIECLCCHTISGLKEDFFNVSVELPNPPGEVAPSGLGSFIAWFKQTWLGDVLDNILPDFSPTTLHECFEAFCKEEIMKDENQYFCSTCNERQNAKKTLKICKLPDILIITLKRFKYSSHYSRKINRTVSFPMTDFDVRRFVTPDIPLDDSRYDLVGMINHQGSMSSGHYVAFTRTYGREWYECDDSFVHPVTTEFVQQQQAYTLVYQCVSSAANQRRCDFLAAVDKGMARGYQIWYQIQGTRVSNLVSNPGYEGIKSGIKSPMMVGPFWGVRL